MKETGPASGNPFNLSGHTALVTGGNRGIGLAISNALARAGARVAIWGRDQNRNQQALRELSQIREGCAAFEVDLNRPDDLASHYEQTSAAMNGIDILVNNAGTHARGRADTIALDDLQHVLRVNLVSPYVLSQCFTRERMQKRSPGNILMIASLMTSRARPNTSAYTASKGGLGQLVKALAVDWASFGIRVNAIGPGYMHTEMTAPLSADPDFSSWVEKRTPLGRWGEPKDIGGAAVFLLSEASAFVTGQTLYIDGGWTASL